MNELILRAQENDKEALNTLIKENVGLVWNVVRRFSNRGYELEDLFQIGCMGFVKAIKKFDVSFGTELSTYSVAMIIGEIKRFLRDDGMIKVSRSLKEIATKVREFQKINIDKDYSIEEVSKILKIDKSDIIMALDATSGVDSLDRNISDDVDSKTIGESLASKENEYEFLLDKLMINSMLENLTDKEREVIICRYYKDMTQGNVAKLYGTSQVQISRIEKKALSKMRALVT
ncbi:MAG: sigma-70 family RNA polymerase sigma factor [Clostridia bacterium]|nr:sigma-70 family RNA polymerase sigma factor [Clostridia bacterium]